MPLASTFAQIWKSGHQLEGRNMGEQAEPFLGGVRFLGLNSSRFLSAFKVKEINVVFFFFRNKFYINHLETF